MSKLRTTGQFQDFVDREFSWRLKEIANLKSAVKGTDRLSRDTLIRAGLALLYAHWEGFVKASAIAYVRFVASQGLRYHELSSCFAVLGLKRRLQDLGQARKAQITVAAFEFIRNELPARAQINPDTAISTEANLSSTVFSNILMATGLNTIAYEAKFKLIDESLLRRRNQIAHGYYLDLDENEWRTLADEIISLLRQFKTDIENAVALSSFKATQPPAP